MIYICDSIMGSGKTESAISYMNGHPNKKYIYITPYLGEAKRIKDCCPDLHFVEPSSKIKDYQFRKLCHTSFLIDSGKNIATTHELFKKYDRSLLEKIRSQGYTLIIDENVDVLDKLEADPSDLKVMVEAGYLSFDGESYSVTDKEYTGRAMKSDIFDIAKSRNLIKFKDNKDDELFYWILPPDLISSFDDVFVLTYQFKGQSLYYFLEIYKLSYKYIGVCLDDGCFKFVDSQGYIPEYVSDLRNKIHIVDNSKMNEVGKSFYDLSINWFTRNPDGVVQLKKNISNFYNNIWRGSPSSERLWGACKSTVNKIRGKGYSKSFLSFNAKATNQYRDRTKLVYAVNIFMNVGEKAFYRHFGIIVDDDRYALSTMLQWIWRSAIRDGKDIYIYVPSRRMRSLLIDWIDSVSTLSVKEGSR